MKKKKEKARTSLSHSRYLPPSLSPFTFSLLSLFFSQKWQPHHHPRIGWWWVISEARRGREWGQNILITPLTQYLSYPPSFPCIFTPKISQKTPPFGHVTV